MDDLIARAEALEAELRGTFDHFDGNHDGEPAGRCAVTSPV